jgi:hypothetical protein
MYKEAPGRELLLGCFSSREKAAKFVRATLKYNDIYCKYKWEEDDPNYRWRRKGKPGEFITLNRFPVNKDPNIALPYLVQEGFTDITPSVKW